MFGALLELLSYRVPSGQHRTKAVVVDVVVLSLFTSNSLLLLALSTSAPPFGVVLRCTLSKAVQRVSSPPVPCRHLVVVEPPLPGQRGLDPYLRLWNLPRARRVIP